MAITSFPFDNQDTDENQFSLLFRELQDSGVADSLNGPGWKVGAGTGMAVRVQPGLALLRGFAVESNLAESRTLTANAGGTLIHRIILRLDAALNTITLTNLTSAVNGAAPILTQANTGIFEISLASVTVPAGAANITESMISDEREFLGTRVGAWTTARRPVLPRVGRTGFNATLGYLEVFTGLVWTPVAPQRPVGVIDMVAFADTPTGWLECNGGEYAIVDYPALATALGNTFGATATPTTTFKVPDLRNRVAVGKTDAAGGFAAALGKQGGEENVALTEGQMPSHTHGVFDPGHSHATRRTGDERGADGTQNPSSSFRDRLLIGGTGSGGNVGGSTTGIGIYNAGGSQSHTNVQPYTVMRYIIKAV